MLRQVAYDTLSRRDRKTRHLTVAAHLRAAFPGDGEEVADVIARHYLDALDAVPDDPDAGQIREQAVEALIRAGRTCRTHRRPGPRCDQLCHRRRTDLGQRCRTGSRTPAGMLWERAAQAAVTDATGTRRSGTRGVPATTTWSAAGRARPPAPRPPPGGPCVVGPSR